MRKTTQPILVILSLLIALCLPINALGAGSTNSDYAQELFALLNDKLYTGVITLQEDVHFGAHTYIYIRSESDGQGKILDLNGHSLSCKWMTNYNNLCIIDSVGGGVLTLDNENLGNAGTLTIDGAALVGSGSGGVIENRWCGTVHLISGSIYTEGSVATLKNEGGVCVIDGGTIHGSVAIESEEGSELYPVYGFDDNGTRIGSTGSRWHNGTLTINGGLIEGDIYAMNTDVTLAGGTLRSWIKGLEYRNGMGELVTVTDTVYELHGVNGEMKPGYWDVSASDWFCEPVWGLLDAGVLGYGKDGNFGPAEVLTRGEAATLLVRICGLSPDSDTARRPFQDVSSETPYATYIHAGQEAGLLDGDGEGLFHPEATVTWQEFAVLVMNAVRADLLTTPADQTQGDLPDVEGLAPWARDAVLEGTARGLWQGLGNVAFAPQAPVGRAEAAMILAKFL